MLYRKYSHWRRKGARKKLTALIKITYIHFLDIGDEDMDKQILFEYQIKKKVCQRGCKLLILGGKEYELDAFSSSGSVELKRN